MTKSELIERLADQARHIQAKELELAIKELLEQMAQTLKKTLLKDLDSLKKLDTKTLLDNRYKRLMSFGYC